MNLMSWAYHDTVVCKELFRFCQSLTPRKILQSTGTSSICLLFISGALGSVVPYGPALCEHCLLNAELQPSRKPANAPLSPEERSALFAAIQSWEAWLDGCETAAPEGFITVKRAGGQSQGNKLLRDP